jgi:carbon monoxide dehydrogenase subunit G
MANLSQFSSRTAKLSCSGDDFFSFITDMRNFGQFIPSGSAKGWHADEESCAFTMPPMGEILLKILSKTRASAVSFSGVVLVTTAFTLHVSILDDENSKANVKLLMEADLNPMLKMMASGPIDKFLDTLVTEMENFREWNKQPS